MKGLVGARCWWGPGAQAPWAPSPPGPPLNPALSLIVCMGLRLSSFKFLRWAPKDICVKQQSTQWPFKVNSGSSKVVIDFGTNRKLIRDFSFMINSNLGPILHRFGDTVAYRSKIASSCPPQSYRCRLLTFFEFRVGPDICKNQSLGSPTVKKSRC